MLKRGTRRLLVPAGSTTNIDVGTTFGNGFFIDGVPHVSMYGTLFRVAPPALFDRQRVLEAVDALLARDPRRQRKDARRGDLCAEFGRLGGGQLVVRDFVDQRESGKATRSFEAHTHGRAF